MPGEIRGLGFSLGFCLEILDRLIYILAHTIDLELTARVKTYSVLSGFIGCWYYCDDSCYYVT